VQKGSKTGVKGLYNTSKWSAKSKVLTQWKLLCNDRMSIASFETCWIILFERITWIMSVKCIRNATEWICDRSKSNLFPYLCTRKEFDPLPGLFFFLFSFYLLITMGCLNISGWDHTLWTCTGNSAKGIRQIHPYFLLGSQNQIY